MGKDTVQSSDAAEVAGKSSRAMNEPATAAVIRAIDLSKRHANGTLALDNLNLDVAPGQIYVLLGAPGAGKTTALDLFLGLQRPTAGRALLAGLDVAKETAAARQKTAYLPAGLSFYEHLSAVENLIFFAHVASGRRPGQGECRLVLREVGLPERLFDRPFAGRGVGMACKLGLAVALLKEAPAMLLDEPLAELDPESAEEVVELLISLRDRGRALLLATHDLLRAKQLADQVGVLKEGRQVLSYSREELDYQNLEELYLGYMRGRLGVG